MKVIAPDHPLCRVFGDLAQKSLTGGWTDWMYMRMPVGARNTTTHF